MLTNQRMKKIDRNEIKDLEKSTRKLYIYRQKDRLQDERGAVNNIIKAQDFLINRYGKKGYKKLINKLQEKTHNDQVALLGMLQDKNLKADIKLVVLASFGE